MVEADLELRTIKWSRQRRYGISSTIRNPLGERQVGEPRLTQTRKHVLRGEHSVFLNNQMDIKHYILISHHVYGISFVISVFLKLELKVEKYRRVLIKQSE